MNVTVPTWEQSWRKNLQLQAAASSSQLADRPSTTAADRPPRRGKRRPWELIPNTAPPGSLRGQLTRPSTAGSSVFDLVNKPATSNRAARPPAPRCYS